jgi:hypothetical protein
VKAPAFSNSVFINCPFDEEYAPLLEAMIFCCIYAGFHPQLANISLENGENRFDKISNLIKNSQYSVHDLSRGKAEKRGEYLRMNMPFECGLDFGLRKSGIAQMQRKKFLIFERTRYDLKRSLSDIAGQDPEAHNADYQIVIRKLREFLVVETKTKLAGPSKILSDYSDFQAWLIEKKISEGHSEIEALSLPTQERIDEMKLWLLAGKPLPNSP